MPLSSSCVCPTYAGIVPKRLNIGSRKQNHVMAHSSFLTPKISAKFERSHPNGASNAGEVGLKSATFDK